MASRDPDGASSDSAAAAAGEKFDLSLYEKVENLGKGSFGTVFK